MIDLVFALVGFACGGIAMMVALDAKRKRLQEIEAENSARSADHQKNVEELRNRQNGFSGEMQRERELLSQQLQERREKIIAYESGLNEQAKKLNDARRQFDDRIISYKELEDENKLLKRDLRNLAVSMRKLELDSHRQQQVQSELDLKVQEIGARYLKENVKWIGNSLNANNFASCKQRLLDVIERCRGIGFDITDEEEQSYLADLRVEYEKEVRTAFEREEQSRIKAQIREEQKLEREIQREQERIAREKAIVEAALARALATAVDEHSAEIESLKARLAEAEEKERAISQAQLTKAGFVYVVSNIGSFGEGVYKIGMTRRLEPLDRIRELGDASVPFPFDIHMMISCQNAPDLENSLHKALMKQQLNKTNPRKEFFRADIDAIIGLVKENHGEVEYVADAEALQYRQSLSMSDEDLEFIEHVFDEVDDDGEAMEDITVRPN
jgi:T5orf172 domain